MNVQQDGAKRIVKLDVQGAFHSKYLENIGKNFADFLSTYKFENNEINDNNIYYNYTGSKEENTNEHIHDLLTKQLYSKVKFLQIIENMLYDGVDTFYEIGPGGNLAFHINNIAKAKQKEIKLFKINNYEDFKNII